MTFHVKVAEKIKYQRFTPSGCKERDWKIIFSP